MGMAGCRQRLEGAEAGMDTILTPRLTLRPCTPADCPDFVALERDPEVMRFLNGGQPVDRSSVVADATFLTPDGTEPYVWTCLRRSDGAFVGWFCLYPETGNRAELGYRLSRSAWGEGLATEGASALADWGFRSAGYETIVASTMAVNQASRRVMEKIGMVHARTEFPFFPDPIPGKEEGEVWYALSAPPRALP